MKSVTRWKNIVVMLKKILHCVVHLDSPTFISHPHFFNGDPVLQDFVLGLHPNEEEHGLFIDIHPVSVHTLLLTLSQPFTTMLDNLSNMVVGWKILPPATIPTCSVFFLFVILWTLPFNLLPEACRVWNVVLGFLPVSGYAWAWDEFTGKFACETIILGTVVMHTLHAPDQQTVWTPAFIVLATRLMIYSITAYLSSNIWMLLSLSY